MAKKKTMSNYQRKQTIPRYKRLGAEAERQTLQEIKSFEKAKAQVEELRERDAALRSELETLRKRLARLGQFSVGSGDLVEMQDMERRRVESMKETERQIEELHERRKENKERLKKTLRDNASILGNPIPPEKLGQEMRRALGRPQRRRDGRGRSRRR